MNIWEQAAIRFFNGETTHFNHSDFTFKYPHIYQQKMLFASQNPTTKTVLFLGWEIPNGGGSLLHSRFMAHFAIDYSHTTETKNSWVVLPPNGSHTSIQTTNLDFILKKWTFVPVLALAPDHDTNLRYLNLVLDHNLANLLGRKKNASEIAKNYRRIERSLPAYVEWHGLTKAYHVEALEERALRLKLGGKLASFTGRLLVA